MAVRAPLETRHREWVDVPFAAYEGCSSAYALRWLYRGVPRLPHHRVDRRFELVVAELRPTPRLAPLARPPPRSAGRRPGRRLRIEQAFREACRGNHVRQGVGSDEEHLIGDFASATRAPSPIQEAEGIVRLTDDVRPRATTDGVEQAARGDGRSTSESIQDVPRLRFRPRRRVRQREGRGEPSVHGHLGDGGLGVSREFRMFRSEIWVDVLVLFESIRLVGDEPECRHLVAGLEPSLSASSGSRRYVKPRESSWTSRRTSPSDAPSWSICARRRRAMGSAAPARNAKRWASSGSSRIRRAERIHA